MSSCERATSWQETTRQHVVGCGRYGLAPIYMFWGLPNRAVHRDLTDKRACYLKLNLCLAPGETAVAETRQITYILMFFDLVRHIDYVKRNERTVDIFFCGSSSLYYMLCVILVVRILWIYFVALVGCSRCKWDKILIRSDGLCEIIEIGFEQLELT